MRLPLALVVALFLTAWPAAAEESEKRAVIRKLIELTQAAQMGGQVMDALFSQIEPVFPQVPKAVWGELRATMTPEQMSELVIPIYERHFTLEEMQGLVTFYESPLGKTMLEKMPAVVQESMSVGNAWGREKAEEIFRQLKERGFEPVQA